MQGEKINSISFAGAGNVAFNLAQAMHRAGFEIRHVLGRNSMNAAALAGLVNAEPATGIEVIDDQTDLLILAIPDQALPGFVLNLKNAGRFKGIVAHTSGSQSMGVIAGHYTKCGVFYPLQSFTKFSTPDLSMVPFCIEGNDEDTESALCEVALRLTKDVKRVDSARRAMIHLAAVFACNFTNFMYSTADCLLTKADVNPDILLPLIRETAIRIKGGDAAALQTGPAVRRDWSTIDMHLNMLRNNPGIREIYKMISELIVKSKETGGAC